MDSSQPSTSRIYPEPKLFDNLKTTDGIGLFEETYNLLKYIHDQIVKDKTNAYKEPNLQPEDLIDRAQRYTGLHRESIKKILSGDFCIDKLTDIDRKSVHDALMKFYIEDCKMPTTTELFEKLQNSLPPYEDIRNFRRKLVNMGYIFRKKGKNFVIWEDPAVRFQRFLYLKEIIQYRLEKRPIYFIFEAALSSNKLFRVGEAACNKISKYYFILAASSHKGIQNFKQVTSFNAMEFQKWIFEELIPGLEENSVVVLDNSKHHCDKYICSTPTEASFKYEMIDWLTYHHIPFGNEMSRVELLTLINKCSRPETTLPKVDIWLKQQGHDVLRIPYSINDLTLASYVRHFLFPKNIAINENTTKQMEIELKKITDLELNAFNTVLQMEEKRLYDLEIKLDNLLEKLESTLSLTPEMDTYLPI